MTKLFGCLIVLQFIVIALHDLVDIPGWTHGSQVQAVIGRRRLWLATLINAIFPGIAAVSAVAYWGQVAPRLVTDYWALYCAVTVASAIGMWYVPYLFGTTPDKKAEFRRMYAGTRHVLPARDDNPRPNQLHVCFHVLFVTTFALAILVWLRNG